MYRSTRSPNPNWPCSLSPHEYISCGKCIEVPPGFPRAFPLGMTQYPLLKKLKKNLLSESLNTISCLMEPINFPIDLMIYFAQYVFVKEYKCNNCELGIVYNSRTHSPRINCKRITMWKITQKSESMGPFSAPIAVNTQIDHIMTSLQKSHFYGGTKSHLQRRPIRGISG